MADITGPISTLPGASHDIAEGTMCDDHPDRPAYRRIQGETDSMGCEMHDLCKECVDAMHEAVANADHSGTCDWCHQHRDFLSPHRDFEEGSSGRVYDVCRPCRQAESARLQEELDEHDDDDSRYASDFYDDD